MEFSSLSSRAFRDVYVTLFMSNKGRSGTGYESKRNEKKCARHKKGSFEIGLKNVPVSERSGNKKLHSNSSEI